MKVKFKMKYRYIGVIVASILLIEILIGNFGSKTYATTIPEKFDLRDKISIVVKNQCANGVCPHMSRSTIIETIVKLAQKNGNCSWFKGTPEFSVLTYKEIGEYVAVSTDKTNKIIEELYNGKLKNEQDVLNVKDECYNEELLKRLSELTPDIDCKDSNGKISQTNTIKFSSMQQVLKECTDGGIIYKNKNGKVYTESEIKEFRNTIKQYIMNKGAVECGIQTNGITTGKNGDTVCFNKKLTTTSGNHSVAIIGWDDTYSKDNFPDESKPLNDGAYLIQNSWGAEWGQNGTCWVSYDDIYVEDGIQYIADIVEYKDITKPVISLKLKDGRYNINVEDKYSSGVDDSSIAYMWKSMNIIPKKDDKGWISIKNGESIANKENSFLCVIAMDKEGNITIESTGLNNEGLIIENQPEKGKWQNKDVVIILKDVYTLVADKGVVELKPFNIDMYSETISDEELATMDRNLENFNHELTVNKEGKHVIYLSKIDQNENTACRAQRIEVWIDKTAPTKPGIEVKNGNIRVISGEDFCSGVYKTEISVTDENGEKVEVEDKNNFSLDKTGKYTISATTIDNAGNSSTETKVIEVKNEEEKTSTDKENDNKISNVDVKEQDSDVADSILPQTGSQTEIILAILVVGTISLARVIYVYRNVKNIKY